MSEQSSMISRSANERADALREDLRGFRDVDALLAEAGRLKREAAAEAEQLVAKAQALADDLLGEAQGRAASIVGDARAAAEASQGRLDSVLGEIESGVRELGGHLEGALRSVNALAQTLEGVRGGHGPPGAADVPTVEHLDGTQPRGDDAGARPLGWLFRAAPQG